MPVKRLTSKDHDKLNAMIWESPRGYYSTEEELNEDLNHFFAMKYGYKVNQFSARRGSPSVSRPKPKRKLSAWNKYVKANSKKPRFRYARSNKINLKKMAIAFRKTPAGRKKRR
jgi:hypothetical protein